MKHINKKAFTLVELIVVMAVIGILVLLAMPKFMGYTKKAEFTQFINNTNELEKASERYYLDHGEWPRLTDTPYTSIQVKDFAQKIYDKTGKEITLDSEGNYYDIDYNKLSKYIIVPDNKEHYIIQNPVGDIYALEELTQKGESRTKSVVMPEELKVVESAGKNIISVDTTQIQGVTVTDTLAEDNLTKAIELAKPGDGIYLKSGTYTLKSNDVYWTSPYRKYSNLVIRKPLTIIGEDVDKTVLLVDDTNSAFHSDGLQFAVTFNADNIILKNVTIRVKQDNIKSLWAIFNVWGMWDGTRARNVTIENVKIIVDSPISAIFYMNDYDFNIENVIVKSNGKVSNMFYWNYGTAHFIDSKFDMPMSSAYGSGGVTTSNTQFNLPSDLLGLN